MLYKCCSECPGDDTCDQAKYCMCGSEMEAHGIGSGHSPFSVHDYHAKEFNPPADGHNEELD